MSAEDDIDRAEYQKRYFRERYRSDPAFAQARRESSRKWHADNKARGRASYIRRRYDLTPDQYDAINEQQRGACVICGALAYSERSRHRRLAVDHCHATGIVRELLCSPCNLMLGSAADNPDILRRAADYLDRHRAIASLLA